MNKTHQPCYLIIKCHKSIIRYLFKSKSRDRVLMRETVNELEIRTGNAFQGLTILFKKENLTKVVFFSCLDE